MKIAVPVTGENQIDDHFGHCESYSVFTVSDNNEITGISSVESPEGCGCKSEIASMLSLDGVTVMLAAGIGDGAVNNLNNNGIEVIRGCSGDAEEVVKLFISGLVEDTGSSCGHHEHHHHEHGHDHEHNCSHDDHHPHEGSLEHEHTCSHHDHHHHEHGHDLLHTCGCN